jgi:hypothetical protein
MINPKNLAFASAVHYMGTTGGGGGVHKCACLYTVDLHKINDYRNSFFYPEYCKAVPKNNPKRLKPKFASRFSCCTPGKKKS